MSKLETNTIDTISGSTDLQLGSTNATIIKANNKISFNNSGDGIYLGVTTPTASNLLDDFEEGTWTGELRGATTAATTPVTATGKYVKIGGLVFVKIYFGNVNTTGASGVAQITGLPFAAESLQILPVMTYGQDYDDTTAVMSIQMYLENNTTAQLIATKDNGAWQTTGITAGATKFFALTGSYYTTA